MTNEEIRRAIVLKHFKVVKRLGISPFVFSHWLQSELPQDKKIAVLEQVIRWRVRND